MKGGAQPLSTDIYTERVRQRTGREIGRPSVQKIAIITLCFPRIMNVLFRNDSVCVMAVLITQIVCSRRNWPLPHIYDSRPTHHESLV